MLSGRDAAYHHAGPGGGAHGRPNGTRALTHVGDQRRAGDRTFDARVARRLPSAPAPKFDARVSRRLPSGPTRKFGARGLAPLAVCSGAEVRRSRFASLAVCAGAQFRRSPSGGASVCAGALKFRAGFRVVRRLDVLPFAPARRRWLSPALPPREISDLNEALRGPSGRALLSQSRGFLKMSLSCPPMPRQSA